MTTKNIFNNFINEFFPNFLKHPDNKNNYYVKGGRVHDVIFKDKTGSIDWDIVATKKFKNMFIKFFNLFSEKYNLTIVKKENPEENQLKLFQYGFEEYDEGDDKFIVDINMYIKDYDIVPDNFFTLNGINYMTLEDFTNDIITLYDKRYLLIKDRVDNNDQIEEIKENVYNIFKINIKGELCYDINKFIEQTLELFIKKGKESKKYIINELYSNIIENIYNFLRNDSKNIKNKKELDKINNSINLIYEYLNYRKGLDDNFKEYIEDYLHILRSVIRLKMDLLETPIFYKKFIKTATRIDNIININWDILSDEYKEYIVKICKNM